MKKFLILFFPVMVIGCGDDDENGPTQPPTPKLVNAECVAEGADCVIRPLAVGNKWTYERMFYGILGDLQYQDTFHVEIEKDTMFAEERWYIDRPVMYTNRSDGGWVSEIGGEPQMEFKYPAEVGQSYTCPICAFITEVVSIHDTASIDMGMYYTYRYLTSLDTGEMTYIHVAPGVGLIEYRTYSNGDEVSGILRVHTSLIEINLE